MAEKISVRLPDDLLLKVDAAGARTDVVTAAVRLYFEPKSDVSVALGVDSGELAAAKARVTKLEHELVIWKNVASGTKTMHPDAVTAARPRSPGLPVRLTQEPIDPKALHPAGSILKHAVPSKVVGNTIGFNLKGMKA